MDSHPPHLIFIVGSGRSGTTALARTISSLPNVGFTPELKFFTNAMSSRRRFEPYDSPERVLAFLRHACDKVTKFNREYGPVVGSLEAAAADRLPELWGAPPWAPMAVHRFVFRELIAGLTNGEPVVVMQTPADVFFVRLIDAVAGPARYVFTYRDPRSFVASAMRGSSSWFHDDLTATAFWNLSMAAGERLAVDHAVTFVRQEDLLADPQRVLEALEEPLDLPGLRATRLAFVNSSFGPEAITLATAQRFRDELTPLETATVSYLTRHYLAKYYPGEVADYRLVGSAARRGWLRARHATEYRRLWALNRLREQGRAGAYFAARRLWRRVPEPAR